MIDLSIIVISFNTKDLVDRCLSSVIKSLKTAPFGYEIIVIDNNSLDGTNDMVREKYNQVLLVENSENKGFGKANNQGAALSKGKYLLFLNSDTEVLGNSIESLFKRGIQQNALYGGKLLNVDKTAQSSTGYFYTLPIVLLSLFLKGDQLQLTRFSPNREIKTDWVSGACLFLSKNIFNQLGGFDENIFMYMDEVDLCYRAKQRGIDTYFVPEARFIHIGFASSVNKREPYINMYQGLLYFYKKHWPNMLPVLKIILKIKAWMAILLGYLVHSDSLKTSYHRALHVVNTYE